MEGKIDTHNKFIHFGMYRGERWTRVPAKYLKWLANEGGENSEIARAELERRGTVLHYTIDITPHAIDRASLNCMHIWDSTALSKEEGLYSWLMRLAEGALEEHGKKEEIEYKGIKFIFKFGKVYPILKTVIPKKQRL